MEILKYSLLLLELGLFAYLGSAALYFLVFSVSSHFYKERKKRTLEKKLKIALLIPAYKEDKVILESAVSALKHESNKSTVEVWVIADSLKQETLGQLKESGACVLEVSFDKSTKAKSINYALGKVSGNFDYTLVLDADNIMKAGFIDRILNRLHQGFRIVQGHRTAKNSNTGFAYLDGISEEVNNNIFRRGHRVLGFSASLIGSGFMCEFQLFKDLMRKVEAVGGFDKELELLLLKDRVKIGYCQEAIVYDEKIQQADAFVNQRRRWLSAQFIFFGRNIREGFSRLLQEGNFDYFDKLIQFAMPPRILTLGLSFMVAFLHTAVLLFTGFDHATPLLYMWAALFVISSMAVFLAIPARYYEARMLKSLVNIPYGFFLTFLALLKIRGANATFIHTTHGIK